MKRLPLRDREGKIRKYAIIDDVDYPLVSSLGRWGLHTNKKRKLLYAIRQQKTSTVLMHRFIMGVTGKIQVDHRDHNGLNNRRENLRISTNTQNNFNKEKYSNNVSGFKGISWRKDNKNWCATIQAHGKKIWLGVFPTAIEAAKAWNKAALKYHGEFAYQNKIPK